MARPRQANLVPSGFLVTQNNNHWSNEAETIKLIEKVINPYVVEKRAKLNLAADQRALLVFKGQVTTKVIERLESLNIECVPNMTHFFQPLDFTVNRCAKQQMKNIHLLFGSCKTAVRLW